MVQNTEPFFILVDSSKHGACKISSLHKSLELCVRSRFHLVAREPADSEAVPDHVAAHHQVLAHGEPSVDVGLAVLVMSVVKVKCKDN